MDESWEFRHHIWFESHFLISMGKNMHMQVHTPESDAGCIKTCDAGETPELIFAALKNKKKKKKGSLSKWNCQLPFNATRWPFEPQLFVSVFHSGVSGRVAPLSFYLWASSLFSFVLSGTNWAKVPMYWWKRNAHISALMWTLNDSWLVRPDCHLNALHSVGSEGNK